MLSRSFNWDIVCLTYHQYLWYSCVMCHNQVYFDGDGITLCPVCYPYLGVWTHQVVPQKGSSCSVCYGDLEFYEPANEQLRGLHIVSYCQHCASFAHYRPIVPKGRI